MLLFLVLIFLYCNMETVEEEFKSCSKRCFILGGQKPPISHLVIHGDVIDFPDCFIDKMRGKSGCLILVKFSP